MADYDYRKDPTVALALAELERRKLFQPASAYVPYPKQLEFHNTDVAERLFFAGNQLGKTFSAAMETAYHLTGEYPKWWKGHRFPGPVIIWSGGEAYHSIREAAQVKLLGTVTPFSTPEQVGLGAIPRNSIIKLMPTRGISDSVDTTLVRHRSGGISTLRFKTYDQEMAKWAGATIDAIWFDEEPPFDLYNEGLQRVKARRGIIYVTMTPLKGRTPLVLRFLEEASDTRAKVIMTLFDVKHYTKEQMEADIAKTPEWEREARLYGRPAAGEGRIIKLAEDRYVIPPCELKSYWPRLIGLDFGMLHPTAAVWLAWDRDRNRLIAYDEYRQSNLKIAEHSSTLLLRGAGEIPVAWPQDGYQREKGSGESIKDQYKKLGLNMMSTHAQTGEAGESLWSSVTDVIRRLGSEQLKIFSSCDMLRGELLTYHHEDGKIKEEHDDLIAALRYAVMRHKKGLVLDGMTPSERAFKMKMQRGPEKPLDPFDRSDYYG